MWSLVLIISLAIAKGDIVADDDCRIRTSEVCKVDEIPYFFPGSVAELEIACNAVKDYLLCGISVEERCNFMPESLPVAYQVLTVVNNVCDKDSQLHKDIVENLECINGFIDDMIGVPCFTSHPDQEKMKKHEKYLIDQEIIKYDEADKRTCLNAVHGLACFALKMDNTCGEVVMNALVNIITRTTLAIFEGCDEEIEKLLPIAVSLHKLEEANEAELEATTESSDICKVPLNETCIPGEAALVFPGTPDQLDKACEAEIDFLECTIKVEEKCQFNPEKLPDLTEVLKLTRKICEKDTALYAGIAANINCAKPVFDDSFGECGTSVQDKESLEAYSASLHREEIPVFPIKEQDQAECGKGLYALACAANKIEERCGDNAMQALLPVLVVSTQPLTKSCSEDFDEYLLDVVRVFKVEEAKEELKEEEIETFFENLMK